MVYRCKLNCCAFSPVSIWKSGHSAWSFHPGWVLGRPNHILLAGVYRSRSGDRSLKRL